MRIAVFLCATMLSTAVLADCEGHRTSRCQEFVSGVDDNASFSELDERGLTCLRFFDARRVSRPSPFYAAMERCGNVLRHKAQIAQMNSQWAAWDAQQAERRRQEEARQAEAARVQAENDAAWARYRRECEAYYRRYRRRCAGL